MCLSHLNGQNKLPVYLFLFVFCFFYQVKGKKKKNMPLQKTKKNLEKAVLFQICFKVAFFSCLLPGKKPKKNGAYSNAV